MKNSRTNQSTNAFTVVELLVLILTLAVMFLLLLPAIMPRRCSCTAVRINCVNDLKQIGLSFRIWSGDNRDRYPMQVPTNEGGTMEFLAGTNVFAHFRAMSNELNTPKVLVCPADKKRMPATNFISDLDNGHLSYFVGVDANETNAAMILAGDRNITNGMPLRRGMLTLRTNRPAGWTAEIHNKNGNIALADGSVQQVSTARLRDAVATTGTNANRLAFP
jgi:prepilin-type processing-associated H-X9-DG protein